MNPNDPPGTPFSECPIPGPESDHDCKAGRCVIYVSGGTVTPESLRAVDEFLRRHGPKEK